jgi:hypothetical protein
MPATIGEPGDLVFSKNRIVLEDRLEVGKILLRK